jgi:hypothetical protein
MRIDKHEKRKRWEKLQKVRLSERIYSAACFDGEEYEGVETTKETEK